MSQTQASPTPDPRRGYQICAILTANQGRRIFPVNFDPARFHSPCEQVLSERQDMFSRPGFEPVSMETLTKKIPHGRKLHVNFEKLLQGVAE